MIGCGIVHELQLLKNQRVAAQVAVVAGCLWSLAVPEPRVLGCDRLQGLAISRGQLTLM